MAWMKELARETGRTVTFNLQQIDEAPELYKEGLRLLDEARAEGVTQPARPVLGPARRRPDGLADERAPLRRAPGVRGARAAAVRRARVAELRRPEVRARLLGGGAIRTDELPADAPIPPAFLQLPGRELRTRCSRWAAATTTSPRPSSSIAGARAATGRTARSSSSTTR